MDKSFMDSSLLIDYVVIKTTFRPFYFMRHALFSNLLGVRMPTLKYTNIDYQRVIELSQRSDENGECYDFHFFHRSFCGPQQTFSLSVRPFHRRAKLRIFLLFSSL